MAAKAKTKARASDSASVRTFGVLNTMSPQYSDAERNSEIRIYMVIRRNESHDFCVLKKCVLTPELKV